MEKEWDKPKNLPVWDFKTGKRKAEVVRQAKNYRRAALCASFMNDCHLQHAELAIQLQKYPERVVLREDDVEDDDGRKAVLTEQGASAFFKWQQQDHRTRCPDFLIWQEKPTTRCQANTQVHMSAAPRLQRLLEREDTTPSESETEELGLDGRTSCSSEGVSLKQHRAQGTCKGISLRPSKITTVLSVKVDDIKMVGKTEILRSL